LIFRQRNKWNLPSPIPSKYLQQLGSYPEILQEILFRRNIKTEQKSIDFLLPKNLDWYSSKQLLHSDKSCQLIIEAIDSDSTIGIYGDYDADGLTGTALVFLALSRLTEKLIPYIPNRFSEGYGLNKVAIKKLHTQGVSLLITVDNGIGSIDEIEYANSLGIKVIVTDHHTPKEELPLAAAILNPKVIDDTYPFKMLAGVGIAYKLVNTLSNHYPVINPDDYLDLVAIGTIADIVPLVSENRYISKQGLISINQHKRQCLVSLLGAANLLGTKISSSDISFQIGPRLNAAGRLGQAENALRLLITTDPNVCGVLAQQLENDNFNRKKLGSLMEQKAQEIILADGPPEFLITAFDKTFNSGVSGIVAGSLARKYNLPVIIGQIGAEHSVASCRSIPEFDLIGALDRCKDLFVRYGGHPLAAGFTIKNSNVPELEKRLRNLSETKLRGIDLTPSLDVDVEVRLDQLDQNLINILERIEPTGAENKEVLFMSRDLYASNIKTVGKDKKHLKLLITDGSYSIDAIGFGLGDQISSLPLKFDALYNFQLNEFRGKNNFQLNLIDLRPS